MKNTYTLGDIWSSISGGLLVGILLMGFLQLYVNVYPLQQEAIKRGYASYTITNSTHQTTSKFTWK
jgi:hypothetical protein